MNIYNKSHTSTEIRKLKKFHISVTARTLTKLVQPTDYSFLWSIKKPSGIDLDWLSETSPKWINDTFQYRHTAMIDILWNMNCKAHLISSVSSQSAPNGNHYPPRQTLNRAVCAGSRYWRRFAIASKCVCSRVIWAWRMHCHRDPRNNSYKCGIV